MNNTKKFQRIPVTNNKLFHIEHNTHKKNYMIRRKINNNMDEVFAYFHTDTEPTTYHYLDIFDEYGNAISEGIELSWIGNPFNI